MPIDLDRLMLPIIQAPLAGGPSTPALAAAVSEAGGLGFLAAGYKTVGAVGADIGTLREASTRPFGVNLLVPSTERAAAAALTAYRAALRPEAGRYGVEVGEPSFDDDSYDEKLDLLAGERVEIVSFTFGCPAPDVISRLTHRGVDAWVTVTSPGEARQAEAAGATALIVQGAEAGGHRGYFLDDLLTEDFGLLALLRLVAQQTALPLIAAGGIMDGAGIAAVLCAGASAAQLGSAFMLTPEAGTSPAHREALATPSPTRLTRAFSGRQARGIVNRFMHEHDGHAPRGYPEVNQMTAPIRAAARASGDGQAVNLWAGQAHVLARDIPAGDLVRELGREAYATLARLGRRFAE